MREQQRLFNANVVLIEDMASGTQLTQELIVDGCYAVKSYKPECDKVMRMHAQTAVIENGFVYVPQTAPWLAEYLHEMAVFPKGKHDDQVDSTAQFLDWLKKPMKGWNIFELYRQRAEALAAAQRGEEVQQLENQLPDLMEIYRRARQGYDSGQNTVDRPLPRTPRPPSAARQPAEAAEVSGVKMTLRD